MIITRYEKALLRNSDILFNMDIKFDNSNLILIILEIDTYTGNEMISKYSEKNIP